jgi:hypothetical protein
MLSTREANDFCLNGNSLDFCFDEQSVVDERHLRPSCLYIPIPSISVHAHKVRRRLKLASSYHIPFFASFRTNASPSTLMFARAISPVILPMGLSKCISSLPTTDCWPAPLAMVESFPSGIAPPLKSPGAVRAPLACMKACPSPISSFASSSIPSSSNSSPSSISTSPSSSPSSPVPPANETKSADITDVNQLQNTYQKTSRYRLDVRWLYTTRRKSSVDVCEASYCCHLSWSPKEYCEKAL